MRRKAVLDTLPKEDQEQILQLCATNSYNTVARSSPNRATRAVWPFPPIPPPSAVSHRNTTTDSLDDRLEPIVKRLRDMDPQDSLDYSTALARLLQERLFAALVGEHEFRRTSREFTIYLTLKRLNLLERKITPRKRDPALVARQEAIWNRIAQQEKRSREHSSQNPRNY